MYLLPRRCTYEEWSERVEFELWLLLCMFSFFSQEYRRNITFSVWAQAPLRLLAPSAIATISSKLLKRNSYLQVSKVTSMEFEHLKITGQGLRQG